MNTVDPSAIAAFQEQVWQYYHEQGRHDLPWRQPQPDGTFDAYHILVSEIMLQQTQAQRVIPKYYQFLEQFPTIATLAKAPLAAVIVAWSGLGYNRRAKFLRQTATMIQEVYGGQVPRTVDELVCLPGVGKNTAGAVIAYAYNAPVTFIETNIRTVFIHHFFPEDKSVPDTALQQLIEASLPAKPPSGAAPYREWYWALMDYGTHLKQTMGNASRRSAHYATQSTFTGSRRQIRGQVLRLLATAPQTQEQLATHIADGRLQDVLDALQLEGMIAATKGRFTLHGA